MALSQGKNSRKILPVRLVLWHWGFHFTENKYFFCNNWLLLHIFESAWAILGKILAKWVIYKFFALFCSLFILQKYTEAATVCRSTEYLPDFNSVSRVHFYVPLEQFASNFILAVSRAHNHGVLLNCHVTHEQARFFLKGEKNQAIN